MRKLPGTKILTMRARIRNLTPPGKIYAPNIPGPQEERYSGIEVHLSRQNGRKD